MKAEHRSRITRLFWILGIALLAGSVLGVTFLLNGAHGSASPGTPAAGSPPPQQLHDAMCLGYVDCEHGVLNLYPSQLGRVVAVRPEGFRVTREDLQKDGGAWLLKVDDRHARLQLRKAKTVLDAAKKRPEQHKLQLAQQELKIKDARQQKIVANKDLEQKREQAKRLGAKIGDKKNQYDDNLDMAEQTIKRLDFLVEAEELKLQELKLADPNLDVERAQAVCSEAQLAVDECVILAPAPGILLRSFVHASEMLGANPRTPAIQFAPDGKKIVRAEILQEWAGRFKEGQTVEIEDDTYARREWTGTIKHIGLFYDKKRSAILEPFNMNDVRTLECIIDVNDKDDSLRIGQRVRVGIVQK